MMGNNKVGGQKVLTVEPAITNNQAGKTIPLEKKK